MRFLLIALCWYALRDCIALGSDCESNCEPKSKFFRENESSLISLCNIIYLSGINSRTLLHLERCLPKPLYLDPRYVYNSLPLKQPSLWQKLFSIHHRISFQIYIVSIETELYWILSGVLMWGHLASLLITHQCSQHLTNCFSNLRGMILLSKINILLILLINCLCMMRNFDFLSTLI